MGARVTITGRNSERLAQAEKDLGHEDVLPVQADAVVTEQGNVTAQQIIAEVGDWITRECERISDKAQLQRIGVLEADN